MVVTVPYLLFDQEALSRWVVGDALARLPSRLVAGVEFDRGLDEARMIVNLPGHEAEAFRQEYIHAWADASAPLTHRLS